MCFGTRQQVCMYFEMETDTNKGKKCIIFQNNKFSLSFTGKTSVSWRCTARHCNATIHTGTDDALVREITVDHHHDDKVGV